MLKFSWHILNLGRMPHRKMDAKFVISDPKPPDKFFQKSKSGDEPKVVLQ